MPASKTQSHLLIVEDDEATSELLAEFCRTRNFNVAVTHDGRAAIAALEREPTQFAVVVTDLHLPGADGFEVLRAAKAGNPACYVVIITGYATIDSAVRAVREGAYDYLAKPFALGQLEIVLGRIRDRMALESENRELMRQSGRAAAADHSTSDISSRLLAIEERLSTIEALIRATARR
jgi:DNA-binding NtrC family response regulator